MTGLVVSDSAVKPASRELFRRRMESQCQQIHRYRSTQLQECGRSLSIDEAALEWIERYAEAFDLWAVPAE